MFFAPEKISFPDELGTALTSALPPSDRHAQTLGRLWEKLAKGRGMATAGETHYSFLRPEAEAYAVYYLPANALKTALVMEEAFLLGHDLGDLQWLDLGTGPGTAFWGLAWWSHMRGKKLQFQGWDQSPLFAELAERISRGGPFGFRPRFSSSKKEDPVSLVRDQAPTHVSFVNSLAEIYPDPAKRLAEMKRLVLALQKCGARDGRPRYLLLIEPGSRESSRELATLKDQLQGELPVKALLPCLDSRPCGALVNPKDWCHEEVACDFPPWLNTLGEQAGLRKESILFSYVLLQVGEPVAVTGGLRIVSQRLERKGQVECWVCTANGKRMVRAQRSKAGAESEPVLAGCRGDIWRNAEIGDKADLLGAEKLNASVASVFR